MSLSMKRCPRGGFFRHLETLVRKAVPMRRGCPGNEGPCAKAKFVEIRLPLPL